MTDTAQPTGIAGAAQSFEALLAGGNSELGSPELADASKATAPQGAEAFEGDDEGDETVEAAADDADAEAAPEDDAPADEENPEDAEPQAQLVTVTINGKTEQIPLEEAVKGYQRQADYSRKTAALSEERKSFEVERQSVTQERQAYAQLLGSLQEQLQSLTPQEPDWQRLYDSDPVEWVRQREVWRDRQEKLAAAQFESQRVQQLQVQDQQQQLAKIVQSGRHALTELVPEWRDNSRWEADRVKLVDYGQKLGFSPEELQATYDPRAVVALHKAMKFDALMAKRPQAAPPRGPKTAPAGSAVSSPKSSNDVTRAKQRLAQTGRVKDAASFFESYLD